MHGVLTPIAHASVANAFATGLSLGVLHIITGTDRSSLIPYPTTSC